MNNLFSLEHAQQLDQQDPLHHMRDQFHIPKQDNGDDEIYLCGNSLGLQPKRTQEYLNYELNQWQKLGVKGHFSGDFPWMPYHEFLTEESAKLVGAKNTEVVCMNSLTANLHFMMVSFYRPSKTRNKILIEDHAFPSDHYAVESQIRFHGFDPDQAMLLAKPREGEETLRTEDLLNLIEMHGDEIALIMLPGVQYYTGQVLDMKTITEAGHAKGCMVGFDLAHATGNIPMNLHDWNVDFAAWCTYKYLNSGPGSVAGCFVHEKHHSNLELPRFAGWWGHDKESRFRMENRFVPMQSAEAWQVSNPPILSLAAIRASLDTVKEAGGIDALREKSLKLTRYLRDLLEQELSEEINILTPADNSASGCQLSLTVNLHVLDGKTVFDRIEAAGVTCDFRHPNVIRVAPVPLYNSFEDAYRFVSILKDSLQ
ncbi:kynureninase [Kangiella koreensis]|uniref:Kynureninase n=1 Tax=Kangiella koreensis (strain DSM 16069 / JCM 12317 / KCTC 12182 / SW-125) TaxID=523791 RepID=C7R815_KANKD|nr:kynureninase [Kangiella koreensis]ACV25797.1 kynureninase [Kangiella koreensis DSM 16069]